MNIKTLIALCLVVAFIASETDAACYKYQCRIIGSYWKNGRRYYLWKCQIYRVPCVKKRDEAESQLTFDDSTIENRSASKEPGFVVPLDYQFRDYDKNKDGKISYKEFQKTMPPASNKEVREGFDLIDKNGDGYVNCHEFLMSKGKIDYGGKMPAC